MTPAYAAALATLWSRSPVDWPGLEAGLPYVADLRACMQDPVYHAEGDVWTHTRMVVDCLKADPRFHALPEDRRRVLGLAALLHDIAKPETRAEDYDATLGRVRITHNKHSPQGAQRAWVYLWDLGFPAQVRADVHAIIFWHQRVFHTYPGSRSADRDIISYSLIGRWHELLLHGLADNAGRINPATHVTADALDLLTLHIDEMGCLQTAWPFETDAARIYWLGNRAERSAHFTPHPTAGSQVVVMSGLPGMGKDTYIRRHLADWPVISLDQLRDTLDIAPDDNQGKVIQAAMAAARVHLRAQTRFVWNATNLTRLARGKIIDLCLAYGATVDIRALDTPAAVTRRQNREREARVPDAVIARMLQKWEPPTPLEAHTVTWVEP
jgi:predicted kinase